jgi:predicted ATPase
VQRVLVTGMSGTGKSTALAELRERGFRTHELDAAQPIRVVVDRLIEIGRVTPG